MIAVGDVVAPKRRGSDLDALLVERVDPVAPALDEPLNRFALRWPTLVRGRFFTFVGTLDPAREVDEGKVLERGKAEHLSKAPASTAVAADLTVEEDQVRERHLDHL